MEGHPSSGSPQNTLKKSLTVLRRNAQRELKLELQEKNSYSALLMTLRCLNCS